jgi:hypothetical protein
VLTTAYSCSSALCCPLEGGSEPGLDASNVGVQPAHIELGIRQTLEEKIGPMAEVVLESAVFL